MVLCYWLFVVIGVALAIIHIRDFHKAHLQGIPIIQLLKYRFAFSGGVWVTVGLYFMVGDDTAKANPAIILYGPVLWILGKQDVMTADGLTSEIDSPTSVISWIPFFTLNSLYISLFVWAVFGSYRFLAARKALHD